MCEDDRWHPIGTAPKDGSPVDLMDRWGVRWTTARWSNGHWSRFSHGRGKVAVFTSRQPSDFTHWMPLPPPPPSQESEG